jgi:hypothetical protein
VQTQRRANQNRRIALTLTPAFRDYRSAKEVKAAFEADKDFVIADIVHPDCGRYVNRPQLVEAGVKEVMIRYKRLTQVCAIKVKP